MNLGCQNATSEKEKNNYISNIERKLPKNITNESKIKSEQPWSSSVLWDSLLKTKSNASFSAKINDKLPEFNFNIIGRFDKNEDFIPLHVEIRNVSDGKFMQKLIVSDNSGYSQMEDIVQLVDLNFDGYLDLRILLNAGATGNDWYDSFIYDPLSGKFKHNKVLSKMSALKVDADSKQLTSYYSGGACEENWDYYKFVKGNLVLIKSQWTEIDRRRDNECSNGFGCFIYTGIPRSKPIKLDRKKNQGNLFYRETMKIIKEEPSC